MSELVDPVSELLLARRLMLVTAESCTGGLIAAAMTERPGSSRVFERGYVTYSNEAKMELLGVPEEMLTKHGAVSAEVAGAMAIGALNISNAQAAIAVTGVAGPDGGSAEKPVGLVYIAAGLTDKFRVKEYRFKGDRAAVRAQSCEAGLGLLLEVLRSAH